MAKGKRARKQFRNMLKSHQITCRLRQYFLRIIKDEEQQLKKKDEKTIRKKLKRERIAKLHHVLIKISLNQQEFLKSTKITVFSKDYIDPNYGWMKTIGNRSRRNK